MCSYCAKSQVKRFEFGFMGEIRKLKIKYENACLQTGKITNQKSKRENILASSILTLKGKK